MTETDERESASVEMGMTYYCLLVYTARVTMRAVARFQQSTSTRTQIAHVIMHRAQTHPPLQYVGVLVIMNASVR